MHITLVIATDNVDANGKVLSENALQSIACQLKKKYGAVKLQNGKLKVAVDGPCCICDKCDHYGPEHQPWCPLWNEAEVPKDDDTIYEESESENNCT